MAALTTVLQHPGVFGKLLLESPPLWVGDGKVLTEVKKTKLLPQKIYMGIGTKEAGSPQSDALILKDFTELEQIFKDKGMGSSRLKVVVEGGAQHNESAWAQRFPDALLFLYGR
jgi:predicted alpha/beta superfamily hydrolase